MKNEQVQPVNYCIHAIEDYARRQASYVKRCHRSVHVRYRLIAMLQNSVKFILRNCCNLSRCHP